LYHHHEIDVVHSTVGAFHIHAGEIFVAAQAREAVVVKFDEI